MSITLSKQSQEKLQEQVSVLTNQLTSFPNSYFDIYEQKKATKLFEHSATLKKLNTLMSDVILEDLDITLGFNNSDGD